MTREAGGELNSSEDTTPRADTNASATPSRPLPVAITYHIHGNCPDCRVPSYGPYGDCIRCGSALEDPTLHDPHPPVTGVEVAR